MASHVTEKRIRLVLAGVLAPLARTLLRCGVSYTEFADLAKTAFVDAASTDYGVRNRPTNIARVAVMTGLSRKEVSRIRRSNASRGDFVSVGLRNLPAEVLHRWHTDSLFLDEGGHPRALKFSGARCSFTELVRRVSADIPPKAMQRELARAGAVRSDGRRLVPVSREFVPAAANEKLIEGLQFGLSRLVETISHNADPSTIGDKRFQRVVQVDGASPTDLPLVRKGLEAVLGSVATHTDDYLTSVSRMGNRRKKGINFQVGVGLYYFDRLLPPEQ